jgi:phosphatidylglycerophosphate synthase
MIPITSACLVGPPLSDPSRTIAGLSLMLRALLSLQEAGIQRVFLVGLSQAELPRDPRLRLEWKEVSPGEVQGPALVTRAGVLWHAAIPRRLARDGVLPEEIVGLSSGPAGIYAAGEEAVGGLLRALLEPASLPAGEAPQAPEFLIAPSTELEVWRAEALLFRSLLKPSDGLISRYLNRPLSLRVSRLLLKTSLTPNHITLLAALIGAVGIGFAWSGGYPGLLIGAVLYQTQSVLDGCDGEIARLKHLKSRFGEWLDQIFDDLINIGFLVAVGHSLARAGSSFAWPVTLVTLSSHTLYQISLYLAFWKKAGGRASVSALRWWGQGGPVAIPRTPGERLWHQLKKFFEDAGKRDFFTFAYVPCALLGIVEVAFVWHAFIATLSGVVTTSQWLLSGGPEASD